MKITIYKNLEVQYNKLFRHLKVGSFKTRERYGKAFKRFMVFLAQEYRLQKLCNISEKHILAYVSYMQSKGLSASTIKTELAAKATEIDANLNTAKAEFFTTFENAHKTDLEAMQAALIAQKNALKEQAVA